MTLPRCLRLLDLEPTETKSVFKIDRARGLLAVVLPLPFGPKQVNAWLLDDGDGWTIVDCGADTPSIRQIWSRVIEKVIGGRPVHRLLITHGHVDHMGFAGPLWDVLGRPSVQATQVEWLTASLRVAAMGAIPAYEEDDFFRSNGVPEDEIERFTALPGALNSLHPLPSHFRRIAQGDVLWIGGREWHVMTAAGHSPDQAAFYCPVAKLLIAGDHVLPRITPFVGVFPTEPNADPLGDFFAALDRFGNLPDDTLVLPSHGAPFLGLGARVGELRSHHEQRLMEMKRIAKRPVAAYQIASEVFERAIATEHGRLALAETLAHLNYLCARGMMVRSNGHGDQVVFQAL